MKTKPKAKHLRNADPNRYFMLSDGRIVKNLLELADVMDDLTEEVFNHHVNGTKNDFAAWVKDTFGDEVLAEKLKSNSSKHDHQIHILRHIIRGFL
ncbi:MAG: DUF5752 family protein [Candidatus Woesearchaeota archaeon]